MWNNYFLCNLQFYILGGWKDLPCPLNPSPDWGVTWNKIKISGLSQLVTKNLEGNITIRGPCDNAHVTSLHKQLLDPLPEAQGQWHGAHGRRSGCFYICLWLKQCELHVPPSLSLFHRSNPMLMQYTIVLNIMTNNERRCLIAHGHQINCA